MCVDDLNIPSLFLHNTPPPPPPISIVISPSYRHHHSITPLPLPSLSSPLPPIDIIHVMTRSCGRSLRVSCCGGVEKGSGSHSTLQGRERSVFNQTNIGTVSRATLGRLLRDGTERVYPFRALRCHLELKLKLKLLLTT